MLAVDPSSPFSGGALLGDRVRMQDHATDDGVFIRSMASRGQLGGLSAAVPQALRVLDAAGCDVVLVETVGVGQAEVEIASLADTTLLVLAPGMGDGIQAAKAGILEIADVFVVNKADRDGADQVARDLRYMQSLGGRHSDSRRVAAADRQDVRGARRGHRRRRRGDREAPRLDAASTASSSGAGARGRPTEIEAIAVGEVRQRFAAVHGSAALDAAAARVVAGETDPYTAAEDLIATL